MINAAHHSAPRLGFAVVLIAGGLTTVGCPSSTGNECMAPCAAGSVCVDGHCRVVCNRANDCSAGQDCRNGVCVAGSESPVRCGNAVLEDGEACDDGADNSDSAPNACRRDCRLPWCGDGVRDANEACDQGEENSDTEPSACRADCALASCGDGILDLLEGCDDGGDNSDTRPNACRTWCQPAACGDRVIDQGEGCDDGSENSAVTPNACRPGCLLPGCGDGVRDTGEICDDGNLTDDGNGCSTSCARSGACGDGVTQSLFESCDDNNVDSFDGCSATCDYLIWSAAVGAGLAEGATLTSWSFGSPAESVVGIGTVTGKVAVFEMRTGAPRWSYERAGRISGPLVTRPDIPRVLAVWDDGTVQALSKDGTAAPLWTAALGSANPGAGLAIGGTGGIAIVAEASGRLRSIDANGVVAGIMMSLASVAYPDAYLVSASACAGCAPTLTTPWNGTAAWPGGVLLPLQDKVYFWDLCYGDANGNPCPPAVFALDPAERVVGASVSAMTNGVTGAGTVEDRGYITTTGGRVISGYLSYVQACASRSLAPHWAVTLPTTPTGPAAVATIVAQTRAVFVGGADGHLYPVEDPSNPGVATWDVDLGGAVVGTPALGVDQSNALSQIVAATENGRLVAVGPDGTEQWSYALGARPTGSPLVGLDAVWVAIVDGRIFALERGALTPPAAWWARARGGNGSTASTTGCAATFSPPVVNAAVAILLLLLPSRRRRRGQSSNA